MNKKKKEFMFSGKQLSYYRKLEKESQSQLARELETTRTTISNLERGIHQPTIDILMRIMQYFDLEIEQIVYEV